MRNWGARTRAGSGSRSFLSGFRKTLWKTEFVSDSRKFSGVS